MRTYRPQFRKIEITATLTLPVNDGAYDHPLQEIKQAFIDGELEASVLKNVEFKEHA